MRVLFILHYPPPVHGSSVIGMQIKESKVINTDLKTTYLNLGTSKTLGEIGKNALRKIFPYINILMQLIKIIFVHKPDLCYFAITVHGIGFYKDALVVIILKLFKVKLVFHLHNKGIRKRQDRYFDNLLYHYVFKHTNVILLSPLLYPDIQKYVSLREVHYCPNGIPEEIRNSKITINKNTDSVVEILFLSNLIESKGVYVLLDACKVLQRKKLRFNCSFVGGFGDINELLFRSKILDMGLINCVNYAGKKYGIEKEEVFSKADIFVLPTFNDCFPLVLLEAMQHNLPIVSTFEGGIPDIVSNGITGYLVKKRDPYACAEKLELLINDVPLRIKMGKNSRIRYEQYFTLQHFEQNLNTIIKKCL